MKKLIILLFSLNLLFASDIKFIFNDFSNILNSNYNVISIGDQVYAVYKKKNLSINEASLEINSVRSKICLYDDRIDLLFEYDPIFIYPVENTTLTFKINNCEIQQKD